jgi:hypothetical protein
MRTPLEPFESCSMMRMRRVAMLSASLVSAYWGACIRKTAYEPILSP